jgi:serine/threonine protein kinase
MFRTLRKVAESFEKSVDAAFSSDADHDEGRIINVNGMSLRLGKVFAEGGFSFVHSAELISGPSHVRYAVKRIAVSEDEALDRAHQEADRLANLPAHPNIVRYYGSHFSTSDAFLVFEMVDGGSLAERLNRRSSNLSAEDALDILGDIVAAVTHLHAQHPEPIACRDLKLENILYDRLDRRYKLCDFGSCTTIAKVYESRREIVDAEDEIKEHCSAAYRSPELVDLYSKQFVCEKTDVWSMGCVWFATLYGKLPFDGQSSLPIQQARYAIPAEPTYPESFRKLISAMLTVSVSRRPDSFTILEAVCRLRGIAMSPDLQRAGADLRHRRRRYFEIASEPSADPLVDSTPRDSDPGSAEAGQRSTNVLPCSFDEEHHGNASHSHGMDSSTILSARSTFRTDLLVSLDDTAVGSSKEPNRVDRGEEGWADFESAFSEQMTQSETKAGRAMSTMLPVSGSNLLDRTDVGGIYQNLGSHIPPGTRPSLQPQSDVAGTQRRAASRFSLKKDNEFADLLPPEFGK